MKHAHFPKAYTQFEQAEDYSQWKFIFNPPGTTNLGTPGVNAPVIPQPGLPSPGQGPAPGVPLPPDPTVR